VAILRNNAEKRCCAFLLVFLTWTSKIYVWVDLLDVGIGLFEQT
jgi:hypothetical protein